jgi:hypothetical protein
VSDVIPNASEYQTGAVIGFNRRVRCDDQRSTTTSRCTIASSLPNSQTALMDVAINTIAAMRRTSGIQGRANDSEMPGVKKYAVNFVEARISDRANAIAVLTQPAEQVDRASRALGVRFRDRGEPHGFHDRG